MILGSGRSDEDLITARLLALQSGGVPKGGVKVGGVDLQNVGDVRKFLLAIENDPTYDTYNPWAQPRDVPLYRGDKNKDYDFRKARNNSDLISTTYNPDVARGFASVFPVNGVRDPNAGIVRKWEHKELPLSTVVDVKRAWKALPETNEIRKYIRGLNDEDDDDLPENFPNGPKELDGIRLITREGEVLVKNSDFMKWVAPFIEQEVGAKRPRSETLTAIDED